MGMSAKDSNIIQSVEAQIYRCDLAPDQHCGYSQGWISYRESAVVRLVTHDGTVGWGEAYAPARASADAITRLAPECVGRSVFEHVAIARSLLEQHVDSELRAPVAAAVSAIAIAASDAAAQLLGIPLYALFGGNPAVAIRPYVSGLWFRPADDPTAHYDLELQRLLEHGFTAVKAKIGLGVEADLRTIERLLRVANDHAMIMADANQAYDLRSALRLAHELRGTKLLWLEEPLSSRCINHYRDLRARTHIPVAAGETITSLQNAVAWLVPGAMDIVQPDVCLCGGLDVADTIAAMAHLTGVMVVPHCYGLGIGLAATLHWATLLARFGHTAEPVWIEVDLSANPARDQLLRSCDWFRDRGATVSIPQDPGLGVNLERIASFRVA